jgi:hypothetical protein
MPFNASLPVDHAQIVAAELRNQFNGLNDVITALPTQAWVLDMIRANAAANVDAISALGQTISNPPTQAQVQAVQNQLNALIIALHQSQA